MGAFERRWRSDAGKGSSCSRPFDRHELIALEYAAEELRVAPKDVLSILGEGTLDIYLNDVAYWKNIPERVWAYSMGGYQVIKKWLGYRESKVLRRAITPDEARDLMNIARRISSILLLGPSLDSSYCNIQKNMWQFEPPLGSQSGS